MSRSAGIGIAERGTQHAVFVATDDAEGPEAGRALRVANRCGDAQDVCEILTVV